MIIPDINLLIHAYNSESSVHEPAKAWFGRLMNSEGLVGLPWVVVLGFIRLTTHPRVMRKPIPVSRACEHVRSWMAQPQVSMVHPARRHADILFGLLEELGSAGNLTTDAHLAALAIELQAELHSTDADFARFPGLRWANPLKADH